MAGTARGVTFRVDGGSLRGELRLPERSEAVVLVTTESCGVWRIPPESTLCKRLNSRGIGTFAVDLLTARETSERENRRDIDLLARRIVSLCRWLDRQQVSHAHELAIYGAETAGPAVLQAADSDGLEPEAVALRNPRFDLIESQVPAPGAPLFSVATGRDDGSGEMPESVAQNGHPRQRQHVDSGGGVTEITEWFETKLLAARPPGRP